MALCSNCSSNVSASASAAKPAAAGVAVSVLEAAVAAAVTVTAEAVTASAGRNHFGRQHCTKMCLFSANSHQNKAESKDLKRMGVKLQENVHDELSRPEKTMLSIF